MSILLSHGYFLSQDLKEQKIMRPYPPLGILSVAAWLEQHEFPCDVLDNTFSTPALFFHHLRERRPRVLGLYVNLMTRKNIISMMETIRRDPALKDIKIILGGPEVRHHAAGLLHNGADIIVFGEGEETMLELARHFLHNDNPLEAINGIAYPGKEGAFVTNPERTLIKDIDVLPFPSRNKIRMEDYLAAWKTHHGYGMVSVNTMRGCPYTCKWCSRAVYGETYRRRSPAKVVEELILLKKEFDPGMIWFTDDVFTINVKWLREFAAEMKTKKFSIPYECITRSDRMGEEVIQLLKETGCGRVWIGAESGSQKILDAMDRRVKAGQVREMILLAKKNGIEAGTFIMLGYPGETREDIQLTVQHLKEANPDHYTLTIAYPITGTPFHEQVSPEPLTGEAFRSGSDRDLRFKKTYSDRFYRHAIRYMDHEVRSHKQKLSGNTMRSVYHKGVALASRGLMALSEK